MSFKYTLIENENGEIKCSYGCGKPAVCYFKNGKYCCSLNTAHCDVFRKKKETKPIICNYCGKEIINYKKRAKRVCQECRDKGVLKKKPKTPEQKARMIERYKKTMLERYGVEFASQSDEIRKKTVENNLKKYGVEYPTQLKENIEKKKQVMLRKYGVENASQLESIKEKKKQTLMKNYGVESPLQSKEIRQKAINTTIERYGVDHFSKLPEYRRKVRKYHDYYPTYSPLVKISWCIYCGSPTMLHKNIKQEFSVCDDCFDYGLRPKMEDEKRTDRNEKTQKTSLEKYGTKLPIQSEIVQNKIKQTNLIKYGVENVFANEEIKDKIKITNLEKYGAENPGASKSSLRTILRDRYIKTKLNKYLDSFEIDLIGEYKSVNDIYHFKCRKCGHEFDSMFFRLFQRIHSCPKCAVYKSSKAERDIVSFLENDLSIDNIIKNSRSIITPKELDIYLPDYNLAIEYHGLYWHSTAYDDHIDKDQHRNKYEKCKEKGIRLIQIFEDEWVLHEDLVKSKLIHILNKSNQMKIYARKCEIREISASEKNEFLDQYHIQGGDKSVIKLGAFFNNELVSVMTFSHGNISKGSQKIEGVWELNRFASHSDYVVVGIASKMLKHFERNYTWDKIFSYADLRWSDGNVYSKLGFDYVGDTKQNYFYVKGMERIHRFNLRKRNDEPKEIPEWMLRAEEGYYQIWDAGHMKFEKHTKEDNQWIE